MNRVFLTSDNHVQHTEADSLKKTFSVSPELFHLIR